MKRKKKDWMGAPVDEFIDAQMAAPSFRLAFDRARTRRIKRALAEAVRQARKRGSLSQTQLAKRVRTTQTVISRIENPDIEYLPSVEVLSRIATALGACLEISFIPRAGAKLAA